MRMISSNNRNTIEISRAVFFCRRRLLTMVLTTCTMKIVVEGDYVKEKMYLTTIAFISSYIFFSLSIYFQIILCFLHRRKSCFRCFDLKKPVELSFYSIASSPMNNVNGFSNKKTNHKKMCQ